MNYGEAKTPQLNIDQYLLFQNESKWQSGTVINLSGYEQWEINEKGIRNWIDFLPTTRLVIFPDISPTSHRKTVPTGVIAEFDINRTPEWLKYVEGADIGCGMLTSFFKDLTANDLLDNQQILDETYLQLKENSNSFALGGGNHFLDFVTNDSGQLGVVIHTGSYGDQQNQLKKLIYSTPEYFKKYDQVVENAHQNRMGLLNIVAKTLGVKYKETSDLVHNTVELDGKSGIVRVYKGVIHVKDKTQPLLLPSSMNDVMMLYKAGDMIGDQNLWGAPHGTGRAIKRGVTNAMKTELAHQFDEHLEDGKVAAAKIGIMTPTKLRLPMNELPHTYHSPERSLAIMESNGLMSPNSQQLLIPIAYIGHI